MTAEPGCVFCRIVSGAEAAHVVLDDEHVVAFLDTRPLFPGHVLVVPRDHFVTLWDLPAGEISPVFERVQRISLAVRDAMGSEGTFVANNNVVSQSVPHMHVHVVPRTKGDGLRGFFWPRTKYGSDAEAAEVASKIAAALGPPAS
jgi:histidine triad (HIT) family protein